MILYPQELNHIMCSEMNVLKILKTHLPAVELIFNNSLLSWEICDQTQLILQNFSRTDILKNTSHWVLLFFFLWHWVWCNTPARFVNGFHKYLFWFYSCEKFNCIWPKYLIEYIIIVSCVMWICKHSFLVTHC